MNLNPPDFNKYSDKGGHICNAINWNALHICPEARKMQSIRLYLLGKYAEHFYINYADNLTTIDQVDNYIKECHLKSIDIQNYIDRIAKQEEQIDDQEDHIANQDNKIRQQEEQIAEQANLIQQQAKIIESRNDLNRRLIDALVLYRNKPEMVSYDYAAIKARNHLLNKEFKRINKLLKLYTP